jgi:D-glycero-D-manno-heptose 1,7-bisphosphate phosphatase
MQKAIFLDRDGIINKEIGRYVSSEDDFELNSGLPEFLKTMQSRGYLLIVITNQGGIAKGLYTQQKLATIHKKMKALVPHIHFTEIYFCPHHPDFGKCLCRKPGSLLVEKALARFTIDPANSYFIGDKERDIVCATMAGVKQAILLESNANLMTIVHQIA